MWSDVQSPAMMGLHVMANKRKLEELDVTTNQPTKLGRMDESVRSVVKGVDAELDDWDLDSTSSVLASSLLRSESALGDEIEDDDDDEDDDDEDDEDEEDEKLGKFFPSGRGYSCATGCYTHSNGYYGASEDQTYGSSAQYASRQQHHPQQYQPRYWGSISSDSMDYYGQDSSSQQTIRCDENGKSYLDLGSSSSSRYVNKCVCDSSRTNWCGRGPGASCYRQRRLAVLNISMCKLGRYRQFPDPSLLRSVLICNTLRYIEREMEQEGCVFNSATGTVQTAMPPLQPAPTLQQCSGETESGYHQYGEISSSSTTTATDSCYSPAYRNVETFPSAYEQNLRDLQASGRATPFPTPVSSTYETDSGMGDEDFGRGINWGSVLSLSNQSDLDPLNNNELYPSSSPSHSISTTTSSGDGLLGDVDLSREFDDFLPSWKLTPVSADDVLKSVPPSEFRQNEGELDLMRALVGTS